jgi:hypothetical protein
MNPILTRPDPFFSRVGPLGSKIMLSWVGLAIRVKIWVKFGSGWSGTFGRTSLNGFIVVLAEQHHAPYTQFLSKPDMKESNVSVVNSFSNQRVLVIIDCPSLFLSSFLNPQIWECSGTTRTPLSRALNVLYQS